MEVHVVSLMFKEAKVIQGVYSSEQKATEAIRAVFQQKDKLLNETVEEACGSAVDGDEFDAFYEGFILDKELANELIAASTETFTVE